MAVHHIVTRFRWMLAAGCDGSFSRSWRGLEQRLGTGRGLEAGGTYEPRVCSSLNELLAPPPVASRAAASRLRAAVYAPPPVPTRRRLLFSISGAQEWTAGGDKLGFGALLNGPGTEGVWPYSDQWWALFDELSRQIVEPYSPKFITTDARMPNKCFPTNNR